MLRQQCDLCDRLATVGTGVIEHAKNCPVYIYQQMERQAQIKEQYGEDAKVVKPYKPNRKQRRAQKAKARRS